MGSNAAAAADCSPTSDVSQGPAGAEGDRPPPPHTACMFYIRKKNRFCRLIPLKAERFCGEHIVFAAKSNDTNLDTGRVRCPLDPKHTVLLHKLARHLRKCNSKDPTHLPFFHKAINSCPDSVSSGLLDSPATPNIRVPSLGDIPDDPNEPKPTPIRTMDPSRVSRTVSKLRAFFSQPAGGQTYLLELDQRHHPKVILTDRDLGTKRGRMADKHVTQISSLLGQAALHGYLTPGNAIIELGAGRGQLAYWAGVICDNSLPILLVDNANIKKKLDHHHKYLSEKYRRINMDIQHLRLSRVPFLREQEAAAKCLAITKHLCGAATDFAITCCVNYAADTGRPIPDMMFTFCCHHRADWDSYVGKAFLQEHGFTSEDFWIMGKVSAWYTCGKHWNPDYPNWEHFSEGQQHEEPPPPELDEQPADSLHYSFEEKYEIGRMSKHVMNLGRMRYLQCKGMTCRMYNYVPHSVTLENVALLATAAATLPDYTDCRAYPN